MDNDIFVIYDEESAYAQRMAEYFSGNDAFPFIIHVFTRRDRFYLFAKEQAIKYLVVAEPLFEEELQQCKISHTIILNETGKVIGEPNLNISKYQSLETIYKAILDYHWEHSILPQGHLNRQGKVMKVIGIYSPVKRCLQTTFSMTLGQMLARSSKVLYINFENYSGMSKLLNREFQSDLSDLVYFFRCVKEKFAYQLNHIVETVNGMDFIPPAFVYPDLLHISGQQWMELIDEIEEVSDYKYLILDLSDYVGGLFDILSKCDKIYTIIKKDQLAKAKIEQYESLLGSMEYQDIQVKTKKCHLPVFKQLPAKFDSLTYGELAAYIKEEILGEFE